MMDKYESTIQRINQRIDYHSQQAINARNWHMFFNILSSVLSGLSILLVSIFTANDFRTLDITITSGCFSFVVAAISKIDYTYSFQKIQVQNEDTANDLVLLREDYENMKFEEFDLYTFNKLESRYNYIMSRANSFYFVCECFESPCFNKYISY